MKNVFLGIFVFLLMSSVCLATMQGSDNSGNQIQTQGQNPDEDTQIQNMGQETQYRNQFQIMGENGQQIQIQKKDSNGIRIKDSNVEANSDLEISEEDGKIKIILNNGRNAEVKLMPNTASERALERLRLKVCVPETCQIELKEVGQGNNTKLAYEIQAERHSKLLGLFNAKMQVRAQIDAENGEILKVGKPWWAFLAVEPEE